MGVFSVITELETIAEASKDIKAFEYNWLANIDYRNRKKEYPALLVESRITQNPVNLQSNKGTFNLRLHFFDLYKRANAEPGQETQGDLEDIAIQFLREFKRRTIANATRWDVTDNTFNFSYLLNPDKRDKVRITVDFQIIAPLECKDGIYTYEA